MTGNFVVRSREPESVPPATDGIRVWGYFSPEIDTSYEVDGIFRIVGCSNADREADVVFVHGLGGDAKQTWHPDGKPKDFWPKWIGEELPHVGVWSLDYEGRKNKMDG